MTVIVGCSGWSYDDWTGPFYPARLAGGERLAYYGRFFPTVEVNSTFYSTPSASTVDGWRMKGSDVAARRRREWPDDPVAGTFMFAVKMPSAVTHEMLVKYDPAGASDLAGRFAASVLEPLRSSSLLGPVLVQLSPFFRNSRDGRCAGMLRQFLSNLGPYEYAIEFRHPSWSFPALPSRWKELGLDTLSVPDGRTLMPVITDGPEPGKPDQIASFENGYVRFHGRNEDIWFKRGSGASPDITAGRESRIESHEDDGGSTGNSSEYIPSRDGSCRMNRYDYEYSALELEPWVAALQGTSDPNVQSGSATGNQAYPKGPRELHDPAPSRETGGAMGGGASTGGGRGGTGRGGKGRLFVFFNNHPKGQAARNALTVMDSLSIPHPGASLMGTNWNEQQVGQRTLF